MRNLDEMPKRVRDLHEQWINGNRKDVAKAMRKAPLSVRVFLYSLLDNEDRRVLDYLVNHAR